MIFLRLLLFHLQLSYRGAVRLYAAKVSVIQLYLLQLRYLQSAFCSVVILSAAKVSGVQ